MMAANYDRSSIPPTPALNPGSGSGSYSPSESPSGTALSPKRTRLRSDDDQREVYGLKLGMLRKWENERKDQLLSSEHALQEIAVAKVRGFLDAIGCVVKLQSWWRMMGPYHAYLARKREQRETKRTYYRAMRLYWKSERMFRVQIFGKFFLGWREEARTAKKLKSLITQFFKICIQRLRLTPQACMAFFNPGEWSSAIAREDMLKIRRLMLEKLFHGWRTETRELRIVRYKASQILSRMVRRTKGPLWVKEATLVCFHMWYRYIKVKKAYRADLPDPRFTNPMLPQWTKLMKDITVARIKRRRTAELGAQLTRLRAFKCWKRLMVVDRSKPVTPLAVAIMHYSTVLLNKVLQAWHHIIRERGKIMRFRNKLFHNWRRWAPKHKQMRKFNEQAQDLIRLRRVQRAYGVMVRLCFNVIGTRTEKIKELRRNFCDRRVVICAYALMQKDSHVMMVDCWRRWTFYWKSRRNWKAVAWTYTYEWHAHKMKVIFNAWKGLVAPSAATPSMMLTRSGKHLTYVTEATEATDDEQEQGQDQEQGQEGGNRDQSTTPAPHSRENSVGSLDTAGSEEHNTNFPSPGRGGAVPAPLPPLLSRSVVGSPALKSGKHGNGSGSASGNDSGIASGAASGNTSEAGSRPVSPSGMRRRQSSFRGKVVFSSPYSPPKTAQTKVVNYEMLVRDFVPKGLVIVQRGVEGKLPTKLTTLQFRIFCLALSRSYAQLAHKLHRSLHGGASRGDAGNSTMLEEGSSLHEDSGVQARVTTPHFAALAGGSVASESTVAINGANEHTDYDVGASKELHFPVYQYFNRALQERLQTAIDQVDMEGVLNVVSEGAVIETQHMRQIGVHIGDMYMPLFTLLLANSVQFFADRVTKQDASQLLLEVQNPINAYLAGAQIERWNRAEITYREMMELTQDMPAQRYLAGEFSSYYLMRFLILKNIDMKARRLLHLCVMLPEHRTVEDEVPEVLKRQKLAKLYRLRKSLTEMIGGDDTFQETYLAAMSAIPPLVRSPPKPAVSPYAQTDSTGKDIYTVLREFTLLTGKLTTEARSIRAPLMERDQRLIENGFLRQARADFLALRQECLTDKQRAEIAEKQRKVDEKERKKLDKQKKAERKKRDKRLYGDTGKGKKGKKGRVRSGTVDFDALDKDATSSDGGYLSETGGEGSHLSELCQLSFLEEGGLNIGEVSDIQNEQDFLQRTAHFKHAVYVEVCQRVGWRDREDVRQAIQRGMIGSMRSTIRRVMGVLQADKTIGKVDIATMRAGAGGLGPWLVNHALSSVPCRRSPTWYVLPKDYWAFRIVCERVNVEIAVTDATLEAIKARLGANHSENHAITGDISMYQKFLKQTRREILKIAEKRAVKADADSEERAPFLANVKKCDVKIKGAEKAIEVIREKLRRVDVQLAAGNPTGAAEVFIPPEDPSEATTKKGGAKKVGRGAKETVSTKSVRTYDFKTVYELIEAAKQEIASLEQTITEQGAAKKEAENKVRMYDWQCQRTSRLMRDLAESRFQTMVDVQLIAVREAKRLEGTEDLADTQTTRYKSVRRYLHMLTDFLEGPIAERGQQLARDAEMRRVSEMLKGQVGSGSKVDIAALAAHSRKRGTLTGSDDGGSPGISFRSGMGSRHASEADFTTIGDRAGLLDTLAALAVEDDEYGSIDGSDFSDGDSERIMEERRRHEEAVNAAAAAAEALRLGAGDADADDGPRDHRTSSQIAVDQEIEMAHHNSVENRMKREAALKALAEEQAKEMAEQDLRIRVFEEYWNALPQNAERVQRRRSVMEASKAPSADLGEITDACSIAEASSVYLNRSDRIWKSIGAGYWRAREERIQEMVENGEDLSDMRAKFMNEVDPLDEDLNEVKLPVPAPKIVFADDLDDSRPETAVHLRQLGQFEDHSKLWAATPQADHVKMMSVSMKEVNATDPERRDSHSTTEGGPEGDHRRLSDASAASMRGGDLARQASHMAAAPPLSAVSRQVSSGNVSRQMSRQISRQTSAMGGSPMSRQGSREVSPEHGHRPGGRGAAPRPDPFALVGKDEYPRFVDARRPIPLTDNASLASSTTGEDDLLRLELSHLLNPHLPTLGEEGPGGKDGDGIGFEDADLEEAGSQRTAGSHLSSLKGGMLTRGASATSDMESENVSVKHVHNMQAYLDQLGLAPSTHTGSSLHGTSTFEQFDRIFDRLADTIVGALETALTKSEEGSITPSVVGSLQERGPDKEHHPHVVPIHTPGHHDDSHFDPHLHVETHEDGHGVMHGDEIITASAKLIMQKSGIRLPDVMARIPSSHNESTKTTESGEATQHSSSKVSSRTNSARKKAPVVVAFGRRVGATPSPARSATHTPMRRRSFDSKSSLDASLFGSPADGRGSPGLSQGSLNGGSPEKRHTLAVTSGAKARRRPSLDGLTDMRRTNLDASRQTPDVISPLTLRTPLAGSSKLMDGTPPRHPPATAASTQPSPTPSAGAAGTVAIDTSPVVAQAVPPSAASTPSPGRPISAKIRSRPSSSGRMPSRPTSSGKASVHSVHTIHSVQSSTKAGGSPVAGQSERVPSAGRRTIAAAPSTPTMRAPTVPTVIVTTSPAVRSARKSFAESPPVPVSASAAPIVYTDTLNTVDGAAAQAGSRKASGEGAAAVMTIQPFSRPSSATAGPVPQEITVTTEDDVVSAIEEGTVEHSVGSGAERSAPNTGIGSHRSRIVFSDEDELALSNREAGADDDDINSEMSPQLYADEHGRAVFYSADGQPILTTHMNYDRLRHDGADSSVGSTPAMGSAAHSPRGGASAQWQRRRRGDTFDEAAVSVAKQMLDNISTELQPPFDEYQAPERYLPEREMREAIFGREIDTGAAGLVSFLQTFAPAKAESPKKKAKKEEAPIEEKGYVAVPIGGEWTLQPSTGGLSGAVAFSPKARPLSPGGAVGVKLAVSPVAKATVVSTQQQVVPMQGFVVSGTAVSPFAQLQQQQQQQQQQQHKEDYLKLKVPALSPSDHRRLALKLGLDVDQQQDLARAAAAAVAGEGSGGEGSTEVNSDLLALVREFYLEKQKEEERVENLKKRATTSFFPPNFRQSQNISPDAAVGEYQHLADLVTDDHSDSDADVVGDDSLPQRGTNQSTPAHHMGHVNSIRTPHFISADPSPEQSGKYGQQQLSAKYAPPSLPHQLSAHYSSKEILAAVATVAAAPQSSAQAGAVTLASSGASRKMSVKMEKMLSRRSSFNPSEVRLQLLESIHSPEQSQLDDEVESAVKEVKKYLRDRQDELNAVVPKGKLVTGNSLARNYRAAVQHRVDPYKGLSAQRSVRQQADQEALRQRLSQRRPSHPASPPHFATRRPKSTQDYDYDLGSFGDGSDQPDRDHPLLSDRRDSQGSKQYPVSGTDRLEHPSRAQEASVHYTASKSEDEEPPARAPQFVLKRTGTSEFWVDVKQHRDLTAPQPEEKSHIPDDHSEVSAGEASMASSDPGEGQEEGDYHDTSVRGFQHDDRALLRDGGSAPFPRSPRHSQERTRRLDLAVTAVKLEHPVSVSQDRKAEGQYTLYRERTPLRSSRRSPSPPAGAGRAAPTLHHQQGGGRKGMSYSHSDGMLLGGNALIQGTKVKLSATTGRTQVRGTGDDVKDDHSAGGDTFNSALSPIMFNLQLKPASPPPMGAVHLSYSLDSPSGSHSGFRSDTPSTLGGRPTTSLEADSRQGRESRSRRGQRQRPASKDIHLSNPSSRPETPSDTGAAPGPQQGGIRVSSTHGPRRHLSSDFSETAGGSHSYKDYRASASAARIISEIAGEAYYYGGASTNPPTSANSVAGSLSAGGSLVAGEDGRYSFPSEKLTAAAAVEAVGAAGSTAAAYRGSALDGSLATAPAAGVDPRDTSAVPSPSQSARRTPVSVKNFFFGPVFPEPSQPAGTSVGAGPSQRSASPQALSRPMSPLASPKVTAASPVRAGGDPVPTIVVPAKQPKAPSFPANIVTAESRRGQEAVGELELLVVPQAMPALAKINDQSHKKHYRGVAPPQVLAPAAATAAATTSKGAKVKAAATTGKATAGLVAGGALELYGGRSEESSVGSAATPITKVAAPVSKVEFSRQGSAGLPRPYSAPQVQPPLHQQQQLDPEAQARLEEEMEADIEQELRQILDQHHREEAQEAYRKAYYQQNKDYMAQTRVASPEAKAVAQAAVPFLAGNHHATGITTLDRMRLSNSVGGGGFSGRGHGVLHKVKAHSSSTPLLPPLDPTAALSVEHAVTAGGRVRGKTKTRKNGERETHNIAEKLLASSDQLVHNKLKLAALLHQSTSALEIPPMTESFKALGSASARLPAFSATTPSTSTSSTTADHSQGSAAYKPKAQRATPSRSSIGLYDVAMSVAAGMKHDHATSALQQQQAQLHGQGPGQAQPQRAISMTSVGDGSGPGTPPMSRSRRASTESFGSVGSLPLQSIQAPAVAVTHHAQGTGSHRGPSNKQMGSDIPSAKLSTRK